MVQNTIPFYQISIPVLTSLSGKGWPSKTTLDGICYKRVDTDQLNPYWNKEFGVSEAYLNFVSDLYSDEVDLSGVLGPSKRMQCHPD